MSAPNSWAFAGASSCIWHPPGERLELKRDEVHLWRADLEHPLDALPAPAKMFTPDEVANAERFRFELHRHRYVVAHLALRTILARYLETSPREPVLGCGSCGRLELAGGALRFSMSRSHSLAVFAISRAGGLGVDIERMRPGVASDLARCISPAALRILEALPQPARRRALFQAWTRLEAYSKASGEGLDWGLAIFEVFLEPSTPTPVPPRGDTPRRWWLHDFAPVAGYVGALVVPPGVRRFSHWEWQAGECDDATRLSPTQLPPVSLPTP